MKNNSSSGGNSNMGDKGRTLPVDPNLPRYLCQNCHNYLCFVGVDSYADKYFPSSDASRSGMQGSSMHGAGSVLASTRMDHSYVVLPKQKSQTPGVPPRPRAGAVQPEASQSVRAMEESFVVLPPPAASVYKSESAADGVGTHLPSPEGGQTNIPPQPNNSGFHTTITVLKRAFDIATTQTQVEQPLCLECMRVLSDKLDKEVEDVNRDINAYEACLKQLEGEERKVLGEADFLKEKLKIVEEEQKLEAAIDETEKQCAEVTAQLKELELKSSRFKELEERYWQEFNNFQFKLISHQEERDAILAKIEVSQAHLDLLKRTNVLTDAFPIGYDEDFGTINNFRLGRLPKCPVEWDEINAAWGQACLLLHTMAQYYRPKFQYRIKILPMGSYPRIMDTGNNTYELFGPVNLFWSTRYDKAMTLFLTCLKDFAEFANAKDKENIPPEKRFKLPYKIENDKVESYSITQSFNKQENWTKALKYTLCNLKWALYWFIGNTNFQPLSPPVSHHTEVTAGSSLYGKRTGDAKF
ncbi:beclin-1-like protein [Coffea eugenioides]|uniref:Beclin-1-like protein n=1 Tax=Coffea arabica TaxID=13443 RepID=A0A6P6WJ06_COFAR|nr:beclin-1-like protein [Coffea arabica]XP_027115413.1 beclin-1-like protein [Coffea arabica]XP_027115414.1 beclin-1-like protein [Coffea arabica]XP_027162616.1 beclin-1-like protein [Coffea eugenioides]